MWNPPGVLTCRARRIAVSGFLLAVAVGGLTACRTSPSVAAYVGEEQVTVTELDDAVADRTADEAVATFVEGNETAFTRRVLSQLVEEEVYAAAAERYGVQVSNADINDRIEELLGDDDAETVFGQLAEQGITRTDVFENVRQQLTRREIALAEGAVEEPSEEELRARYEDTRESMAEVRLGYITVPDQATADALAAQLRANPAGYAVAAARYPGPTTLAEIDQRAVAEVPPPLVDGVAAAEPNSAFTVITADVQGVVVGFVEEIIYPTFDELRPELEQEFTEASDAAGVSLVDEVRADLDVVINPRYGVLDDAGELVPGDGGVVQLLEDNAAGGGDGGAED